VTKTPLDLDIAGPETKKKTRRPSGKSQDKKLLQQVLLGLSDIKAEDLLILDLRKLTSMTDYFIVAHGTNDRQVAAMAREVERRLQEAFDRKPLHVEGLPAAQWVLMDYGDFIVHLFLAEKRKHYDIEGIWADAPRVEL
jgi:ribosome-associated protein